MPQDEMIEVRSIIVRSQDVDVGCDFEKSRQEFLCGARPDNVSV